MRFHIAPRFKAGLRPILLLAVGAILLPALALTAAPSQAAHLLAATTDPRFGLVDAMDAPNSADASGASWELLPLDWDKLEPSAGAWTPSPPVDDWVAKARGAGRDVVGELISTPAWATDGKPVTGVPRGLYLPVSDPNNQWASFVRQAVGYYGTRGINHWVIWDSPDIPPDALNSKWDGTTEDYYQLVKVAYLVAKAANPGAIIHLGAVTDKNPAWYTRFLTVVVADSTAEANNYYFDVASVQIYASPDRVYTLTANPSYLMDQAGVPLKPVWINATNARPAVDPKVYPPDNHFNQYSKITLDQQAAFIIQAFSLGFAAQADRIAVYRLADNLNEDGGQAFGLVRTDNDPRPAFEAYQLAVQQMSGFKLARRVDEDAHPLIEYVRFTFPTKVTHVAWALTAQTATLIIPARSTQATLINMDGQGWTVKPDGGIYKLVVGGADCNDPNTVGGCLVGGDPWFLVEDGVQNPLTEAAPKSRVELGGVLPTPPPTPTFTPSPLPATATALPTTPAPTQALASTIAPSATGAGTTVAEAVTAQPAVAAAAPAATAPPTATPSAEQLADAVRPRGLQAVLPYLLMGLGVLAIGGGAWFFLAGHKPTPSEAPTEQSEWVAVEPDELPPPPPAVEPDLDGPPTRPSEPTSQLTPPPDLVETRAHKRPRPKRRRKPGRSGDATQPSGFNREEAEPGAEPSDPPGDEPGDDEPPLGPAFGK